MKRTDRIEPFIFQTSRCNAITELARNGTEAPSSSQNLVHIRLNEPTPDDLAALHRSTIVVLLPADPPAVLVPEGHVKTRVDRDDGFQSAWSFSSTLDLEPPRGRKPAMKVFDEALNSQPAAREPARSGASLPSSSPHREALQRRAPPFLESRPGRVYRASECRDNWKVPASRC